MKDGSGLCHVFRVSSINVELVSSLPLLRLTLVVVDGFEHLLRRNKQMCHLPHCHLEVHLRKFEEPANVRMRHRPAEC